MSSTKNVVDHLADHLAIRSLLDRYTDGVNRRDWAAVERVFATDGVWDCGGPTMGPMAFRFSASVWACSSCSSRAKRLRACKVWASCQVW